MKRRGERERRGGGGGGGAGVRSSIKVQLCNFIPVPAQWGMRLSSIWTCSRDLLTSVWGALCNTHTHTHTHTLASTHARTCIHTPTHPWSPSPCQHPSREIRRLETGQPWPMYIFMGLIWHHFSLLPEKEMYLIYTIPIWPVHQGEIHRESRPTARASPLQHGLFCKSVCIYKFVCACLYTVCQHAQWCSVCV